MKAKAMEGEKALEAHPRRNLRRMGDGMSRRAVTQQGRSREVERWRECVRLGISRKAKTEPMPREKSDEAIVPNTDGTGEPGAGKGLYFNGACVRR